MRLFYAAGLISEKEVDDFAAHHETNKPILDVLHQEVSLESFRDLLTAELTFKRRRSRQEENRRRLRQGLAGSGIVNDAELQQLLANHRPPVERLVGSLSADKVIDDETAERITRDNPAEQAGGYESLVSRGSIAAAEISHWLSRIDSSGLRPTALSLALVSFQQNQMIEQKDFERLSAMLDEGKLDEVKAVLAEELGLTSARLQADIEKGLELGQVHLESVEIDPKLFDLFPESLLRRNMIVPYDQDEHAIWIATSDPLNLPLAGLIHWISGRRPYQIFAPGRMLIDKLNAYYQPQAEQAGEGDRAATRAAASPPPQATPARPGGAAAAPTKGRLETDIVVDNTSAVQLVSSIIENAIDLRTTDVHLEPTREGMNVRFRIDGELHRIMRIPAGLAQPVTSRIKVLSDMDVTERRRPQDGHFELALENQDYDFRISTLPSIMGEKIVIRILDVSRVETGMEQLGMLPSQLKLYLSMLTHPYGMVLVTGPTGSGKTSTLYAGLEHLNEENRNLVTIEDPVEYQLEGINQVQVDPQINVTFSNGLRSILRQDPDVIMVGEIRDADTAQIAIRAALTGHLVLSTLHTNSALGAVDALVHLGAKAYTISSALLGLISQRLIRQLCKACRKGYILKPDDARQLGLPEDTRKKVYRPVGCDQCLGSGYLGRTGVFELIQVEETLRPLIATHRPLADMESVARERKMMGMQEAGAQKVLDGETSIEELARKILLEL